jgi:hypothetical protein
MAITIDGANKLIVLDTATSFTTQAIYDACVAWAVLTGNMQYLLPMDASGYESLGGGLFTDAIRRLINGYKLKPSGYAANTQITVVGTLIVDDGSNYSVPPTTGSPVTWQIQVATAGIIVNSGSGLDAAGVRSAVGLASANLDSQLGGLPTAAQIIAAINARVIDGTITAIMFERILLAFAGGDRQGLGTALEQYMRQGGTTPAISFAPSDTKGNGTTVLNGS